MINHLKKLICGFCDFVGAVKIPKESFHQRSSDRLGINPYFCQLFGSGDLNFRDVFGGGGLWNLILNPCKLEWLSRCALRPIIVIMHPEYLSNSEPVTKCKFGVGDRKSVV